jgi:hypothetical protein
VIEEEASANVRRGAELVSTIWTMIRKLATQIVKSTATVPCTSRQLRDPHENTTSGPPGSREAGAAWHERRAGLGTPAENAVRC